MTAPPDRSRYPAASPGGAGARQGSLARRLPMAAGAAGPGGPGRGGVRDRPDRRLGPGRRPGDDRRAGLAGRGPADPDRRGRAW